MQVQLCLPQTRGAESVENEIFCTGNREFSLCVRHLLILYRPYDKLISIVLCEGCNETLHGIPTRKGHRIYSLERERLLHRAKKAKSVNRQQDRALKKSEARKSNTDRPATSAVMSMLETRESPLLANSIERIMNDDRTLTVDLPTWTGGDTKAVLGDSDYTIRNPQIYFQRESVIKAHSGRASEAPLQSMERMSRKSVPNNIKVGDNFNGKSAFIRIFVIPRPNKDIPTPCPYILILLTI